MARFSQNVSDDGADEMSGSRFFRGIDKRDDLIDRDWIACRLIWPTV
jgi:hypothetical protein